MKYLEQEVKMILKARKKPVVVEAVQWTGKNWNGIKKWMGNDVGMYLKKCLSKGNYIVKNEGIISILDNDIFNQTYEIVEETQ